MKPKNSFCANCNHLFVSENEDQLELNLCGKCLIKYLVDTQTRKDMIELNINRRFPNEEAT